MNMKWKNKKRWVLCAAGLVLLTGMIIFLIRDNYFTDSIPQESEDEFMSEVRLPLENELDGINWIIPSKKW